MARHLHTPVRRNRQWFQNLAGGAMDNVHMLTQAYSQAPWRKQIQVIVFFLLVLVMLALIAGIYLNVSARTVAAGVEIQMMEAAIEETQRSIQDLQAELAFLTSSESMEERARQMGLEPVEASQIEYIEVQGYPGRPSPHLAPAPQPQVIVVSGLSPQFTESLIDWVIKNILTPSGMVDFVR